MRSHQREGCSDRSGANQSRRPSELCVFRAHGGLKAILLTNAIGRRVCEYGNDGVVLDIVSAVWLRHQHLRGSGRVAGALSALLLITVLSNTMNLVGSPLLGLVSRAFVIIAYAAADRRRVARHDRDSAYAGIQQGIRRVTAVRNADLRAFAGQATAANGRQWRRQVDVDEHSGWRRPPPIAGPDLGR